MSIQLSLVIQILTMIWMKWKKFHRSKLFSYSAPSFCCLLLLYSGRFSLFLIHKPLVCEYIFYYSDGYMATFLYISKCFFLETNFNCFVLLLFFLLSFLFLSLFFLCVRKNQNSTAKSLFQCSFTLLLFSMHTI